MLILEREQRGRGQETDYGTRHHEDAGPHGPIQRGYARRGILAGVTPLGAGQTLEHHFVAVQRQLALGMEKSEYKLVKY